jgi:hypothetical protein
MGGVLPGHVEPLQLGLGAVSGVIHLFADQFLAAHVPV